MLKNAGNAPSFADIDTNSDGKITTEEFQAHQQQNRMKNKPLQGKCGR
ncbi:EF-hand domain-containing protein [Sulfurovum zhangzhouensis]